MKHKSEEQSQSAEELLRQVKKLLNGIYGKRLKDVVLYGSHARKEAQTDSDIDLLVILGEDVSFWNDIRKITHALYPLQLEIMSLIHALPVKDEDYDAGDFSLYRNVKREGIVA